MESAWEGVQVDDLDGYGVLIVLVFALVHDWRIAISDLVVNAEIVVLDGFKELGVGIAGNLTRPGIEKQGLRIAINELVGQEMHPFNLQLNNNNNLIINPIMATRKKEEQKKQITSLFQEDDSSFWQYKKYEAGQVEKIDQWFSDNQIALRPLAQGLLYEQISTICSTLGVLVHA